MDVLHLHSWNFTIQGQFICEFIHDVFDVQNCVYRDGKVRFGPVLQWILENPEPDYWFGPLIMSNLGPDRWFSPKRSGSGS